MPSINNRISYMYVEYTAAFHMKYKHLFVDDIYDSNLRASCPFIITWAEMGMAVEDGNAKSLAISTKSPQYLDSYQVSEEFFEDALQAFFLFPDTKDEDEDSSTLRLEFVKALLNK